MQPQRPSPHNAHKFVTCDMFVKLVFNSPPRMSVRWPLVSAPHGVNEEREAQSREGLAHGHQEVVAERQPVAATLVVCLTASLS